MKLSKGHTLVLCLLLVALSATFAVAQETTAGLQGTVKDPQGAVVSKATVEVSSPELVGVKKLETDSTGYYRFSNLPPGEYTITVTAAGFRSVKRTGIMLDVGKLPSIDIALQVGGQEQTVEVSGEAPVIDVTQTKVQTTINQQALDEIPKGRSFQSVIALAPGARNEPLQGVNGGNGYQISGGANSENAYLIEGQETASIYDGTSQANTPFEFIQEVQVKTSAIEAEHAGAMGGVVNAVQKRGTNNWHGSVWSYYEGNPLDAGPRPDAVRYDPAGAASTTVDPAAQIYQPKQDKFNIFQPGFSFGGPIAKNRIFVFASAAPQFNVTKRTVNFNDPSNSIGIQNFEQDTQTYYSMARVDAALTSKMRVFASYLYQLQDRQGNLLPHADSANGLYNISTQNQITNYEHGIGYVAPNVVFNVGLDYTITPTVVATTRYGHFFQNYADRGLPSAPVYSWSLSGLPPTNPPGPPPVNLQGVPFQGTPLGQNAGYVTGALEQASQKNAFKHDQFSQDIAWFKSGWLGTHNLKFGYQLNHLYNDVAQVFNGPLVRIFPGGEHTANGAVGQTNCAAITAANLAAYGNPGGTASKCGGLDGYLYAEDYSTFGNVSSYNHGLYGQDAWTLGRSGVTINVGIRTDKEYLPYFSNLQPLNPGKNALEFNWADKLAPRIGAAWDVFHNGKMKVFGSYGKYFDLTKLDVIVQSFGGAYWHNCFYALDTTDYASIVPQFANGHYCAGDSTTNATFAGGNVPSGVRFIENINYRASAFESVDPNLKPYSQHESVFGADYQLSKNWALEARWDRRRVDRAVEDAGAYDSSGNEIFNIVNPGYGLNAASCPSCPANVKAVRDYDALEFRLTKSFSRNWYGQFSYTWSRLWGNYSGLTDTDLGDSPGGNGLTAGRADPNNNRAFDESWFMYDAYGHPAMGPLATDRPNTFKAFGYYNLPWGHRQSTLIGLTQQVYQGTPMSSYMDIGPSTENPTFVEGRGKWVNITADPTTGFWTVNGVGTRRTPVYSQTDANFVHNIKVSKSNENLVLSFEANVINLFNQNAVVAYYSQMDSFYYQTPLTNGPPSQIGNPLSYLSGYDWKSLVNQQGVILSSQYGKPLFYQTNRTVRFKVGFTF
jgi:hypothetical protein